MNSAENAGAINVGPQYCSPNQIDLTIKKKSTFSSPYRFVVTDDNDNIIFNVKPPSYFSNKKVIFDAAGNPILTLSQNFFSSTWKAYRGESSDEKDLIFSAKGPKIFHPNTRLRVYKANNSSQDVPDFKVKGKSMLKKASMAIYVGDESSTIVAQQGTLPFTYLGCPIFYGRLEAISNGEAQTTMRTTYHGRPLISSEYHHNLFHFPTKIPGFSTNPIAFFE